MQRNRFPASLGGRYLLAAASLALALAGVTSGTAQAGTAAAGGPLPLVVRTDHGLVRGLHQHGAREFLGIPYAAPPTGANAWRPPQPLPPWRGVRAATKPGHDCAQTASLATGVLTTSMFENCLFLNVYTPPQGTGHLLPVMVWIHGGGFTGGAGRIYDGAALAARHHVIVVTINYRLSAFGFLALPSLAAGSPDNSSGNYGLMDQQAAMRWVQGNAFAFGGNPGKVTIFGESAGGASVCANMASPTALGLFARAIAESGCIFPTPDQKAAQRQGTALARSLGCTKAGHRGGVHANQDGRRDPEGGAFVRAVLGPGLRRLHAAAVAVQAFETGRYLHVPLLQGSNHDEGRVLRRDRVRRACGHPLTAAQYPGVIAAQFGAKAAPAVLAHYPLSAFASPDLAFAKVLTDSRVQLPGTADRHPHPAQRDLRLRVQRPAPAERLRHQVHVPARRGAQHGIAVRVRQGPAARHHAAVQAGPVRAVRADDGLLDPVRRHRQPQRRRGTALAAVRRRHAADPGTDTQGDRARRPRAVFAGFASVCLLGHDRRPGGARRMRCGSSA